MTPPHPFYETIHQLRSKEAIVLYSDLPAISDSDEARVRAFLEAEYSNEKIEYPYTAPAFDPSAAIWAAKLVYTAAQLLLYRKDETHDLPALLPEYKNQISTSSMVSADLVLRFLPEVLHKAMEVDEEDVLVPILKKHLQTWHYSGILFDATGRLSDHHDSGHQPELKVAAMYESSSDDKCFRQLYIDRIIISKHKELAKEPMIDQQIKAALGNHYNTLWKS